MIDDTDNLGCYDASPIVSKRSPIINTADLRIFQINPLAFTL